MSKQIVFGVEGETEVRGLGCGLDGFLRAGKEMPAGIRLRAAEMSQSLLFLFCGHLRSFAGIKADENDIVVAAGVEGKHAQHANNALLDLIAKHGAAVVDKGENHRLLPFEIAAELNGAAGFVAESEVQRHLPVQRRFESDIAQN